MWVGDEDHIKVIAMQKGGDLGAVYSKVVKVGQLNQPATKSSVH